MVNDMKNKKKIIIIGAILILTIIGAIFGCKFYKDEQKQQEELKIEKEKKLLAEINSSYSEFVITKNEAKLYVKNKNKYNEVGTVYKDIVLGLEEQDITVKTKYFKVLGLDQEYYISYKDVIATEPIEKGKRYLNYILMDKTITTKETTNFYLDEQKKYSIKKSFTFPVYIIDGDKYYVEYDNQLMYILKEDIEKIEDKKNSDQAKAKEIATILYHFVYDPAKESCNEVICHTVQQVQSHIDYLKQNSYFTPTMKEFEMWIDGKLNLPKKSIMITLDDGSYGFNAAKIFTDNKMNATLFVVSSWFNPKDFETEYFEVHSHSFNLHNAYACPGQGTFGGGIQCLPKETLLKDLKESRERTNMTTVFAYPFYDFNEYSIQILKEAGFTMGFGGYYENGLPNMVVGGDKFRIPRFTFEGSTTTAYLKWILSTYN
ncbi:MAG: hypothetical protein E7169_02075 [Firmicutes bacterium]|nr:hypothetical protein [Bacillota bacterium]